MKHETVDELVATLKKQEGFRPSVYKDTKGHDTVWYGCKFPKGGRYGRMLGEFVLRLCADFEWYTLYSVHGWVKDLPERVQMSLANMCFQMGGSGVTKFTAMLGNLEKGDYAEAWKEALDSDWFRDDTPGRALEVAEEFRQEAIKRGQLVSDAVPEFDWFTSELSPEAENALHEYILTVQEGGA